MLRRLGRIWLASSNVGVTLSWILLPSRRIASGSAFGMTTSLLPQSTDGFIVLLTQVRRLTERLPAVSLRLLRQAVDLVHGQRQPQSVDLRALTLLEIVRGTRGGLGDLLGQRLGAERAGIVAQEQLGDGVLAGGLHRDVAFGAGGGADRAVGAEFRAHTARLVPETFEHSDRHVEHARREFGGVRDDAGPSPGIAGRQIRLQRSELDPLALDGGGGTRLPDFLAELLEPFERLGSRAIALPVQGLLGAGGVGGFARRDRDELGK